MNKTINSGVSGRQSDTPVKPETQNLWQRMLSHGLGEYIFALFTIVLAAVTFFGALDVRVTNSADTIGPRAFPFLVALVLFVSGVLVVVDLLRGKRGQADDGEDIDLTADTDWVTVVKIVALLILHSILIPHTGWWIAAAILFFGVAWSLGAKKLWIAGLIGLSIGLIIQIAFGVGLGLSLPNGPLLDWIPFFRG